MIEKPLLEYLVNMIKTELPILNLVFICGVLAAFWEL